MKLRGKKIYHTPVMNNFTKIPNELFGIKMNHIDKLVLMRLYYYPKDFVLAFTRIAKELGIGVTTIKESWKRLKRNGYIIETDEYYKINLSGTGNDHKDIGTASVPKHNQGTGNDLAKVREMDVPESVSDHRLVQVKTLNDTGDVPNEEETKEEKENNKTKEQPLDVGKMVVGDCGVSSDVATHPFGVAPSPPPQPQLCDEKKITTSKYTSNENERLILLNAYNDYLNHNPNSKLTFDRYEDILLFEVAAYEEYSNKWNITKWEEVISRLTPERNIQYYNHFINSLDEELTKNDGNCQQLLVDLKKQIIASNQSVELNE